MFYEIRDKRYDSGSSCLGRCWVLVAMCGLLITVSFIGMTLWLGVNSRPDVPAAAYQPPSQPSQTPSQQQPHSPHNVVHRMQQQQQQQQLQHTSVYDTRQQPAAAVAGSTTVKSAFPTVDYDAMPTTSIKNKKGRIEIVEHEKMAKIEPTTPSAVSGVRARVEAKLGDGVNPMTEDESSRVTGGGGGVRKKSEVVYPNWSERLDDGKAAAVNDDNDNDDDDASGPHVQDAQQQRPYYGVNERPDATQKFNPIPAFSYLKEHPVRLTGKDIRPPGTAESEEYPYFYPQFEDVTRDENTVSGTAAAVSPVFTFLRKRLQDVRDWLSQSGVRKDQNQWIQMVDAVNRSLYTKNATIVLSKLREMYGNSTGDVAADTPVASLIYPAAGNDSAAGLVSFGLLAIDLFLLHNVQQIALNEDPEAGQQMLNDPDVLALNALFLPPDRVKQLRSGSSRVLSDDADGAGGQPKGLVSEFMEFVNGGLRAVLNLSRAYRSSSRAAKAEGKSTGQTPAGSSTATSGSSLDCIWTLYCRNLDKTAKLEGPYGFLAKMNRYRDRIILVFFRVFRL